MTDCELQHALGAYVLGGLEPEEATSVTAHLRRCATCRAHHAEIATTPDLLALATDAPPRLPPRVRDRVVAGTTRHRLRRRWTAIAAAAAGVAALAGGLVGWLAASDPEPRIALPLQAEAPFDVTGWAWVQAGDDELHLELELTGLEPLDEPQTYEAWLYTPDERILSIGQLPAADDDAGVDAVTVELTAPGSLDNYRGLWVTAEPDRRDPAHEGPTVVRARLP